MISVKKKTVLTTALVLLLTGSFHFAPHPIFAADEEARSTQETTLETITVTAEKREENVQEVTSSITVLSDIAVEDAGIESTRDIWKYVPNMTTSHSGTRSYWSRIKFYMFSNKG